MTWLVGRGHIAGEAPASADPGEPDGRFRKLNVPSQGRIDVLERRSRICVASVISKLDGTWRVDGLNPALHYVVIGYDDLKQQNAAIQDWIVPAVESP